MTCTDTEGFSQIEMCDTKFNKFNFELAGQEALTVPLGETSPLNIFASDSELIVTIKSSTTDPTIINVTGNAGMFKTLDFNTLTKIETIDLKGCHLLATAEIKSQTTNDVTLDLSKNVFSDFKVKLTGTFDTKLKTLRLNDNDFKAIESKLYTMSGLKTLYMARNPITEVKASAATTLGDGVTTSITYLGLQGNTHESFPTGLCNPPALKEIDLFGATVGTDKTLSKWLLDDVKTCVGRNLTIHAPSDKFDCDCENLGKVLDTNEELKVDTCKSLIDNEKCPTKDLAKCDSYPKLKSPFTKTSVDQACSGVRVPPGLFVMALSFVFTLLYK